MLSFRCSIRLRGRFRAFSLPSLLQVSALPLPDTHSCGIVSHLMEAHRTSTSARSCWASSVSWAWLHRDRPQPLVNSTGAFRIHLLCLRSLVTSFCRPPIQSQLLPKQALHCLVAVRTFVVGRSLGPAVHGCIKAGELWKSYELLFRAWSQMPSQDYK